MSFFPYESGKRHKLIPNRNLGTQWFFGSKQGWIIINKKNFSSRVKPNVVAIIKVPTPSPAPNMDFVISHPEYEIITTIISTDNNRQGWTSFRAPDNQIYRTKGYNILAVRLKQLQSTLF